ncbi:hypothetical protein [Polyangium aurulentum]|uniref:hypothetical protein n=1 Tax=Polyangium aurulentum TaxID=2567896 RepID=UPI0010AE8E2C|nr:hypothetical protein [Polyangium aurulentum]UQA55322.1 hypothetical protein E8A73_028715 [Polyangium aurulentum]
MENAMALGVFPKGPDSSLNGDGLVGLIGQRWDAAAVQELLQGLCAHEVVETAGSVTKNRHVYLASGVVVEECVRDRRVVALHLYGPGTCGVQGYPGELPQGLGFGMERAQAHVSLGPPDCSGLLEGQAFDAWELNECMLRVTYDPDEKIAQVGLLRWYPLHKRAAHAALGVHLGPPPRPTPSAA